MRKQTVYTFERVIPHLPMEVVVSEVDRLMGSLQAEHFHIFDEQYRGFLFFQRITNTIIDCLVEPRAQVVGHFEGTRNGCKLYVEPGNRLTQFMEQYYLAHKDEFAHLRTSASRSML